MTITEVQGNLLDQIKGNFLFSISADLKCSIGDLKDFNKKYLLRDLISKRVEELGYNWDTYGPISLTLTSEDMSQLINTVIVKPIYNYIPTIENIKRSLIYLRDNSNIAQQIIMPKICCDEYNQLKWENVKQIIEDVFKDTTWDFIVYSD